MKKIIIYGILLFFIPALLLAKVKIYLTHSFSGKEKKALEIVRDYFNYEHPDIELVLRQEEGETVIKRVKNRRYRCDLFIWAHDIVGSLAEQKLLYPIDGFLTDKEKSQFISTALNALEYGSSRRIYGLPLSIETLILVYNKSMVSRPPATLTELIEDAKKYTDWKQGKFGLLFPSNNYYFNAMFLHSFGGRTFDEAGKPLLDSEAQAKTVDFVIKLADSYHLLPLRVDKVIGKNAPYVKLFNEGKVAYFITGPWDIGRIKGVDFGVAPLPKNDLSGRPLQPFLGIKAVYMLSRSRHKKEAYEVMRFIASPKMQYILSFIGGFIPANLSAYSYDEIRSDPIKAAFKKQAVESVPMPNTPNMRYIWEVMNTRQVGRREIPSIYERAYRNPKSLRYFLRQAQKYCVSKIKNNRRGR